MTPTFTILFIHFDNVIYRNRQFFGATAVLGDTNNLSLWNLFYKVCSRGVSLSTRFILDFPPVIIDLFQQHEGVTSREGDFTFILSLVIINGFIGIDIHLGGC